MIPYVPYDAEIEYLESTGTQYISTGLALVESTDVLTVGMAEPGLKYNCTAWWCTRHNLPGYLRRVRFYDNNTGVRAAIEYTGGTSGYTSFGFVAVEQMLSFVADFPNGMWSAGGESGTFAGKGTENSEVLLFDGTIRVGSFSLIREGVLVRDMIPVRVGNVGYMYDRVTKRLFGNQGTGSFILGPDVAKPVMGLHFYRPNPEYTTKAYVQDGLVAMWDGIENVGRNKHDSTSTTWKDLINGNDITVNEGTTWGDGYIYRDSNGAYAYRENTTIQYLLAECVCDWSMIAGTSNTGFLITAGNNINIDGPSIYGNWADWYNSGRTKYFCKFLSNGRPTKYAQIESLVSDASALCGTLAYAPQSQLIWRNGLALTMNDQGTSYYYNNTNIVVVGTNNKDAPERNFKGKIYAIRLYGRILTDSEIAANYAIDKARFNLP